jgi:hypothetical protein
MRLKPKTYVYIFYSLLAGVLLSLIFVNSLSFVGEQQTTPGTQITEPAGTGIVDQLLPDHRFMHRSQ